MGMCFDAQGAGRFADCPLLLVNKLAVADLLDQSTMHSLCTRGGGRCSTQSVLSVGRCIPSRPRHLASPASTPTTHTPAAGTRPSLVRLIAAATFHLGYLTFPSKKAAREEAKSLLLSLPLDEPIRPGDKGFEEYLWYLWHHHYSLHDPEHKPKGVSHFSVRQQHSYTPVSTCFWVHFTDGSFRGFSYQKCLDNRHHTAATQQGSWTGPTAPRTARQLAKANSQAAEFADTLQQQQQLKQPLPDAYFFRIMRTAVQGSTAEFKWAAFHKGELPSCTLTGKTLEFEDAHVDHYDPPFAVLADDWLHQQGLELAAVHFWAHDLEQSWQRYHDKHANLRLVSKQVNMSGSHAAKQARAARRRQRQLSGSSGLGEA